MLYQKPALTVQQQIAQLQARGLVIDDLAEATHFLSEVSYYRLSGFGGLCNLIRSTTISNQGHDSVRH